MLLTLSEKECQYIMSGLHNLRKDVSLNVRGPQGEYKTDAKAIRDLMAKIKAIRDEGK